MFEIIKTLAEEPVKLRKLIVFLLKFIFSAIISSKLYALIFGEFELINLTIPKFWNELYHFAFSGEIVIVFFLYLVSRFLLFDVFASIPNYILNSISKSFFSNKGDLSNNELIRIILEQLKIIIFDKETKKIKIGENFDNFYEILNEYQYKETKEEVNSFKKSLMNETLHIYFVFVIIYLFFLEVEKSDLFITILIIGLVINVLLYLIVYFLIQFFNNNGKDILFGLHILNTEKVIVEFLNEYKIPFTENKNQSGSILSKFIFLKDKESVIDIYTDKIPVNKLIFERYAQQAIKFNKKRLILISNMPLTIQAKKNFKNNQIKIDFLYYKNNVSLNRKMEKLFF